MSVSIQLVQIEDNYIDSASLYINPNCILAV